MLIAQTSASLSETAYRHVRPSMSTAPSSMRIRSPPWTKGNPTVTKSGNRLENGDHPEVAIDFDQGAVRDRLRRAGHADDRGDAELARHDHRVAHLRADLHDDALGRDEERRPRRIGYRRDQDLAGAEAARVGRIEHHASPAPGLARTAGDTA